MPQALRRALRPTNIVYLLCHVVLALLGFVTLGTWESTLAEAVGSSLIAAGITGWVVFGYLWTTQRSSEQARSLGIAGVTWAFPARSVRIKDQYDSRLAHVRERIDILGFGLSALLEDYGNDFPVWAQRAEVRVLLVDPEHDAWGSTLADQRDVEEQRQSGEIASEVRQFLQRTTELRRDSESFNVRLYRCIPAVNIFRVDDELFWGPYLLQNQSRNSPTLIVERPGFMFTRLTEHFDAIWTNDRWSRPA